LNVAERSFLYMPLMHAEDVALQRKGIAAFDRLKTDAAASARLAEDKDDAELASLLKSAEDYANFMKRHADIVERFGRFPHRNAILNRASTSEEVEFLKQPGSSFL